MDEACGARNPTHPSDNSTRSSAYHLLACTHMRARARARKRERERAAVGRQAEPGFCEGEENPALIAVGEVDW